MVQTDRPQMEIYYGACTLQCWIIKAIDTHSEYAIRIAHPRQKKKELLRERTSMLR